MREDIAKILVTRPRLGSGEKNSEIKKSRQIARDKKWEDLPKHSSMKPKKLLRHRPERRQLNEYLNPLIKYLHKNCGRTWNSIYSDISALIDRRNIVQEHIYMHLFGFVEINPEYINGEAHNSSGSYRLWDNGYTFYVDKIGILRKPKKRCPEYKEELSPNLRRTDNKDIIYYRRDGTWFEVQLEKGADPFTYSHWKNTYYDKLLQRHVSAGYGKDWQELYKTYGRGNVHAAKLKTLSKKEKKTLKLI